MAGRWTPERDARLAVLWAQRITREVIAAEFGASVHAVHKRAKRIGLPLRAFGAKVGIRDPRTLQRYETERLPPLDLLERIIKATGGEVTADGMAAGIRAMQARRVVGPAAEAA